MPYFLRRARIVCAFPPSLWPQFSFWPPTRMPTTG